MNKVCQSRAVKNSLIQKGNIMYKEASYKEKYTDLADWMPSIIEIIKREIKNEHLKKDLYFVKKFLNSKNVQKVSIEELSQAYQQAINEAENGEEIGDFITARWLLKHTELYDFFENHLSQLAEDFTSLDELDQENSKKLMDASIQRFGAVQTYLFSVLNSVVFPLAVFEQLKTQAQKEKHEKKQEQTKLDEKLSLETLQKNFEHEIGRLTDKYEKKLSGLQKKYVTDVDGLKKQIASLQRKLQEKS